MTEIDFETEMDWMLELLDKGFKAAIIKMCQQAITDTFETIE